MALPIEERNDLSAERFESEIRPAGLPIVMRGFADDWAVVQAANVSNQACANYIASFANSEDQTIGIGPHEIGGLFHYNEKFDALNFGWGKAKISQFLAALLNEETSETPKSMAMQALNSAKNLIGFEAQNPRKFIPSHATPYLWIGNALKVATHNDPYENLACCVAGVRRFTIFPPNQVSNLYMGPLLFTPAGQPISMVHLTAPDLARYPKFAEALKHAQYVDLYPGDALYLPYHWYHHVESKTKFNILANFWWNDTRKDIGSPWAALMAAITSVGNLPPDQRAAWAELFKHYALHENGNPYEHLPENARGPLFNMKPEDAKLVADYIKRQINTGLPT